MFQKFTPVIPLLLIILFISACVRIQQPHIEAQHYTLEYAPPEFPELEFLPATLQVEHFTTSPIYDTDRIVYRDESFSREAYHYHRWRTRPGSLVRNFLLRDLTRSSLFQAVVAELVMRPDYSLQANVEEFLEWDLEEHWLAVLTVSVSLASRDANGRQRVILQRTFSNQQPAARKEPRAVAEAMSLAMAHLSEELIRAIHAAIAEDNS